MQLFLIHLKQVCADVQESKLKFILPGLNAAVANMTKQEACIFLAHAIHESANLSRFSENLNYSADGLLKVFPKYFKTRVEAELYARNPEKIANRVYANRMGNLHEGSGDGWAYRGRGLFQLTGKNNYRDYSKWKYNDERLLTDPAEREKLATDAILAVSTAVWFWNTRGCQKLVKYGTEDEVSATTKVINGGLNGLEHRVSIWKKLTEIL